ncbi:MAG: ORF6N domain-containing protein [Candidatus Margulisiibacteriota bacterium]
MAKSTLVGVSEIQTMIIELRGHRVILDKDLAKLYSVPTKRLIEQVKRNQERFPSDFIFQLTDNEFEFLRSQFATSSWGGRRYLPYAFTRNGANMVCAILKSPIAIQRSIQIMRAFSVLEEVLSKKKRIVTRSPNVLNKLSTHSRAIMHLFQKDKVKTKEIGKIKKIIHEMIKLLQKMVVESL